MSRRVGGFTVLELLAALFVVMIMAGIAVPVAMRGIRHSRMRSAASQVASGLRRARNLAIASGEIYCARFYNPVPPLEGTSRVDIYWVRATSGVPAAGFAGWSSLGTGGGVNLPRHTRITFPLSQPFVAFLSDGSAWDPEMFPPQPLKVEPTPDYVDPLRNDSWKVTVRSLSGRIETKKVAP